MKTIQHILAGLFVVLMGHAGTAQAEDIDIYSGPGDSAGKPNVLIVFDNAANFSSNAAGSSCIIDGAPTALSGTVGGIEQCAFYNVVSTLPDNTVNIGMMVYNATNIRDINNANCGGANGGCLVVPISPMTAANKALLLAWIKTWRTSGGAGDGYIKANGEAIAATMQEAWAYYSGNTGLSGRDYSGVQPVAGCQKNFVIFIGNSYSSSGTPGDGGSASPASALTGAPGVTAAQTALITTTHATTCGTYTFPASAHESNGYYADEWSRYMRQHDVYDTVDETQRIITYTIGLLGSACQAEYAATLTSMANVGGGKYFATTDYSSITQALLKILNEVQAVNSVFSSSSLPVSVNAQGTYLNQIYMGMFRPDPEGDPRWVGNLKQYKFSATRDPVSHLISLSLADSLGASAINPATGFITPNAVSYWTCGGNPSVRACSPVADPTSGFWVNDPINLDSVGGAYDLPDGEFVDKGGAAQIVRLANLTNNYATEDATGTYTRKLYTYCPSGSGCNAALSHSSNAFVTTNTNITAEMFGASSTVNVSNIVRTGTSALVTTSGAHGYSTGNSVTINGATQNEYNVTQNITVNSTTTFTITGLPDKPTTPSAAAYSVSLHNSAAQDIDTIVRSSSSTAVATNSVTATVTTHLAHGYSNGSSVLITGASPSDYGGIKTIATSGPTSNQFTYSVPIYPTTPAANTYKAVVHPYTRSISSITKVSNDGLVTTTAAHGFHVGQSVTISGTGEAAYNGTKTITAVGTATTFKFSGVTGNPGAISAGATVIPSTTPVVLGGLARVGTTVSATATATGVAASAFANGDTVDITLNTGTAGNESAYIVSGALITCSGTCTTFTYPITVTPALSAIDLSASETMQVALSAGSVAIPAGSITRSGDIATVTGVANAFITGATVDIATSGTALADESAYTGTWIITCPVSCSTAFTFGPVTVSPATPATGAHITAYQGSTPPAKDPLINWVRGQDNFGDEHGPNGGVTIRPSLHGDVLHSRPVTINYGGTTGVVVFYGGNDGVFRAVNGNKTAAIGAVPAGGELWGFIPTEFFGKLDRLRTSNPILLMTSTPPGILPAPLKKDYFADGSTGVYQELDADGTTNTAYLYISMRRGDRLIYALDVTDPTDPEYLWKITNTGDFIELGQTWSAPVVATVKGYSNPVMIFGAGYDTAEDAETVEAENRSMGRGIYIVDATTGVMVWSATQQAATLDTVCSGTATKATCLVEGMDFSIPSDITLMDADHDGMIDRLYAVDVGGNVWRVDLQPSAANYTPQHWQVNKVAALGCATGVCADGSTSRKFFYPADVVPTKYGYDAVVVGSGDREHPLYIDVAADRDRIYMLKDVTGNDGSSLTTIVNGDLFDATSATYTAAAAGSNGTTSPNKGYYIDLRVGEKSVNAPLTVAGFTYLGTNQPTESTSCSANLGIARGYKLNPLTGEYTSTEFAGGGLPPSPVAGVVEVTVEGETEPSLVPFIIGGGGDPECVGADCASALGGGKPVIDVSTSRRRTYWYQLTD